MVREYHLHPRDDDDNVHDIDPVGVYDVYVDVVVNDDDDDFDVDVVGASD